jgi:hypothetical protein
LTRSAVISKLERFNSLMKFTIEYYFSLWYRWSQYVHRSCTILLVVVLLWCFELLTLYCQGMLPFSCSNLLIDKVAEAFNGKWS